MVKRLGIDSRSRPGVEPHNQAACARFVLSAEGSILRVATQLATEVARIVESALRAGFEAVIGIASAFRAAGHLPMPDSAIQSHGPGFVRIPLSASLQRFVNKYITRANGNLLRVRCLLWVLGRFELFL